MMKRNIVRISLALMLILSLCLSIGSPAIAAKPEEKNGNKPVASLTWTGSNGKVKDDFPLGHIVYKFQVKKLSDGSVFGDAFMKVFSDNATYEYELIDAYFDVEDDYNVADVLVTLFDGSNTWFMSWHFEDRGEPGKDVDIGSNYLYLIPNIPKVLVDPWPPPLLPISPFPWLMLNEPGPVGQVQIKITEAYYD